MVIAAPEASGVAAVSVILCTHDRPDDLAAHLPSVVASARSSALNVEIVVVDNAPSDDRTESFVRSTACVYVKEPRQGLGRARNAGVESARGQVLLFVDDDVEVPENWVDSLSAPLIGGRCSLVAGAIRPGPGLLRDWMGAVLRSNLVLLPLDGAPSHLIGASFAAHRDVFDKVRFDDELGAGSFYGSAEDTFFYEQATEAGFVTLGCATASVIHHFDIDRMKHPAMVRTAEGVGRSQAYIAYHWLHTELRWLRIRLLLDSLRLVPFRLRRAGRSIEGISDGEFHRRAARAYKRQLLVERTGARHYDRRGLVKVR